MFFVQTWNDELAYLATLNVMKCQFGHDSCFSTTEYPYAGQNIYSASSWPNPPDTDKTITTAVDKWWSEYKDAKASDVKKYPDWTPKMIGHFTQVAKDNSPQVGCGMIRFKQSNGYWKVFIACNYAFTNMVGEPIYVAGKTGSKCKKMSANYQGLCA